MLKEVTKQFVVSMEKAKDKVEAVKYFMDWRKRHEYGEPLNIKRIEREEVYVIYYIVKGEEK